MYGAQLCEHWRVHIYLGGFSICDKRFKARTYNSSSVLKFLFNHLIIRKILAVKSVLSVCDPKFSKWCHYYSSTIIVSPA